MLASLSSDKTTQPTAPSTFTSTGVTLTKATADDAHNNLSALPHLPDGATDFAPFPDAQFPAGARERIANHVRQLMEPFSVEIVTTRPDAPGYRMAVVTASTIPELGAAGGDTAVASMQQENPGSVVFVFSSSLSKLREINQQTDAQLEMSTAIAVVHEIGHSLGLAHVEDIYAIMARSRSTAVQGGPSASVVARSDFDGTDGRYRRLKETYNCPTWVIECPYPIQNSYVVLMDYYGAAPGYFMHGECAPGRDGWLVCLRKRWRGHDVSVPLAGCRSSGPVAGPALHKRLDLSD